MEAMDLELIGWIGNILLAVCGVPQAYTSYTQGHSRGLSPYMLYMWFIGEVLTFIYIVPLMKAPLIFNYSVNILALLVIIKYAVKERK